MSYFVRASLVLFIAFAASSASASPLSSWTFRVLRTEHFEIIYREEQKPLAKIYALAAEQAYELLIPIFKEAPYKTIILISDETDASNGMATFLPYPVITVFPVTPATLDSIDDYGDWPLEMIVHEYTHILNMYPAHGFYIPLKWIFGGVIRPNAVLPKWYLEGLAVNTESHLTDHGRLRADQTQAAARALVLAHRLPDESVARMNEQDIETWPHGARPYLYGGWWWENVQRQYGVGVIETWNQNFARRLPFLLNGPMREQAHDKDADQLRLEMIDHLTEHAERQIKTLRTAKPNSSQLIAEEGGEQSVFALSPSAHDLVYWNRTSKNGTDVKLKKRQSLTQPFQNIPSEQLFKAVGTLRVRWMGPNQFIFDQLDIRAPHVTYRDLYSYDLKTRDLTRLTEGERAQEPAPSPSGDRIAFIQNDGGRTKLMLMNMESHQIKTLVSGSFQQRLSGPEFLNENELLFAVHVRAGNEKIYDYVFSEHKAHVWNEHLQAAQNLKLTAKGVLVADSGTHVRNIYLATPSSQQALTNTLTELELADFDSGRNELIASELSADGRRLVSIPYAAAQPPVLEPNPLEPPPKVNTTKAPFREEGYWPIEYLWPRYWIPFVYPVENGVLVQGMTSNSDPAGRNRYTLMGAYDTLTQKPSYGIDYTNSSLPTDIEMSYGKMISYLGASGRVLESQYGGLNLINTWPFNNRYTKWNLGGLWNQTDSAVTTYRRAGPQAGLEYSRLQSPLNSWYGIHASISHEEYLPQTGYIDYGHTYAHLAQLFNLGGGHKVLLQTRAAAAPRLPFVGRNVSDLGDRTVGANYLISLANSDFLLRGYPSGTFVGRKIVNGNLEYSLPAGDLNAGWGTFPLFLKSLELVGFADAVAVDGLGFRPDYNGYVREDLSHYFMGTGAELRLSTTTAYHIPVSLTLGAYYGLNLHFGGGFSPFLGLGLGDLGALENKTP